MAASPANAMKGRDTKGNERLRKCMEEYRMFFSKMRRDRATRMLSSLMYLLAKAET